MTEECRGVHPVPSGEVKMTPLLPTATNFPAPHAASLSHSVVPEVRPVQVSPSDEVRIVPLPPTATHMLPFHAAAVSVFPVPDA